MGIWNESGLVTDASAWGAGPGPACAAAARQHFLCAPPPPPPRGQNLECLVDRLANLEYEWKVICLLKDFHSKQSMKSMLVYN